MSKVISYIKGTLVEIGETWVVVESGQIGYQLFIPTSNFAQLPPVNSEIKLFTHLQIREDIFILYGFLKKEESQLFQLLISVTGIGPKGAVGILSALTPSEVYFAVLGNDIVTLCKAPGVGKKTAQRMILELKDKLKMENIAEISSDGLEKDTSNQSKKEAVEALVALGYQRHDAFRVIQSLDSTDITNTENMIKEGLKRLTMMG